MLGPRPCITRRLDLRKEDVSIHAIINTSSLSKQLGIQAVYLYFKISPTKIISRLRAMKKIVTMIEYYHSILYEDLVNSLLIPSP